MATPLPPPYYARHARFRQQELAGQPFQPALLDSELDALLQSVNQSIAVLRGITDATGKLKLQQPLREMAQIEVLSYVATAAQNQFYVAPVTDVLTDRAEVRFNIGNDLYAPVDQSKVSLAAAPAVGTVTATQTNNVYVFSSTLPDQIVGARLIVNGTDAGRVTGRLSNTQAQTDTPWPLATVAGATFTWQYLGLVTLTGVLPGLSAGQKVQIGLFTDGAGALTQLGSASATEGARQVAVFDVGNLFGAGNVEDALQELATQLSSMVSTIGPVSQYLRVDGSNQMTGPLDGGGQPAVGFAPGLNSGELVVWDQISSVVAVWNDLQQYYLKRDGTTPMGADLPMGQHRITQVADGVDPQDAVNKRQIDTKIDKDGSVAMEADLDMNTHKIVDLADGSAPQDAVTVKQLLNQLGGSAIAEWRTPGVLGIAVPVGITRASVEMWGGGGGGNNTAGGAAGGGGGGYLQAILPVTSGEALTLEVGAGGAPGGAGGTTRIKSGTDVLLEATGGNPGTLVGANHTGGTGGSGSSPVPRAGASYSAMVGGPGRAPVDNVSGPMALSGCGGDAPRGGSGGSGSGSFPGGTWSSVPPTTPGGGGAGAGAAADAQTGAAGGIIVRWS